MSEWRLSKEIPFGVNRARFLTLYDDVRDTMSDSVRADMGIAEGIKNRCIEVEGPDGRLRMVVSKDEGNAIYREMVKIDGNGYDQVRDWVRERMGK